MSESQPDAGSARPTPPVIRVARGNPDAAELAAVTAVLLTRTAAAGAEPDDLARRQRAVARWHRPERETSFADGRSWRGAPR